MGLRDDFRRSSALQVAAWYNPLVPVLLPSEPLPRYRHRATELLSYVSPTPYRRLSLRDLVSAWSLDELQEQRSPHGARVRALACHLAGLFGQPWPEGTP